MRVFIELAYDGTRYHGWQRQPQSITVQAVLEDTMARLFGGPCPVMGCGRTDAGVHASYFVAHAELPDGALGGRVADWEEAAMKLNGMLPHDIGIFAIHDVGPKAHARFDATERGLLLLDPHAERPLLGGALHPRAWQPGPGGHESRRRPIWSRKAISRRSAKPGRTKARPSATCGKPVGKCSAATGWRFTSRQTGSFGTWSGPPSAP